MFFPVLRSIASLAHLLSTCCLLGTCCGHLLSTCLVLILILRQLLVVLGVSIGASRHEERSDAEEVAADSEVERAAAGEGGDVRVGARLHEHTRSG